MPFKPPRITPKFADLKTILSQSAKTDEALYQTIEILLERLDSVLPVAREITEEIVTTTPVAIHAPTHGPVGSDPITALDGAVITTGQVSDARLSTNVALENITNIFTADQNIERATPILRFIDTAEGTDQKQFRLHNESQLFSIQVMDDSGVVLATPILMNRSGDVTIGRDLTVNRDAFITTLLRLTGGQILFPATQVPSTNANTLDDYEEGAFTCVDSSGAGLAFSSGAGRYVKIGRKAHVQGQVVYPATANGAVAQIGGLPFASPLNGTVPFGFSSVDGRGWIPAGVSYFRVLTPANVEMTNVQMSGANVVFAGSYDVG